MLGIIITIIGLIITFEIEKEVNYSAFPFASLFLALNPAIWLWAVGGLETPLCMLLIALILFDEFKLNTTRVGAISAGLLAITRPEMPLILIIYLVNLLYKKKTVRFPTAILVILAVAPLLLYIFFRIWVYAEIFPNTYFAKAQSHDIPGGSFYLLLAMRDFFFSGL